MYDIIGWVKDQTNSATQTVVDTYQGIINKYTEIKNSVVATYNNVQQSAIDTYSASKKNFMLVKDFISKNSPPYFSVAQFWGGLTHAVSADALQGFSHSEKTRDVLSKSFWNNIVIYMGIVLFYEAGFKRVAHAVAPDLEDSYAEKAMDGLMAYNFIRIALRMLADNIFYQSVATQTAAHENQNQIAEPCKCKKEKKTKAAIMSPVYYGSTLLSLKLLSNSVPGGQFATLPLLAYAYGQNLLENNVTQSCTRHRAQWMSKRNAFVFGYGVSFLGAYYLYRTLLSYSTGVKDNFYVDAALFAFLYQYFTVTALMINKQIPPTQKGIDLAKPIREMTKFSLNGISNGVMKLFPKQEQPFDWVNFLQQVNQHAGVAVLKQIALLEDQQSLEDFLKSPACNLFLDSFGDDIQGFLKWLISVRNMAYVDRAPYVLKWIPNFVVSKNLKTGLDFLVDKQLDGILEAVQDYISKARLKIEIPEFIQAITHDAEALKHIEYDLDYKKIGEDIPKIMDVQALQQVLATSDRDYQKKVAGDQKSKSSLQIEPASVEDNLKKFYRTTKKSGLNTLFKVAGLKPNPPKGLERKTNFANP